MGEKVNPRICNLMTTLSPHSYMGLNFFLATGELIQLFSRRRFNVRIQPHTLLNLSKLDEKKSLIVKKIINKLGMGVRSDGGTPMTGQLVLCTSSPHPPFLLL